MMFKGAGLSTIIIILLAGMQISSFAQSTKKSVKAERIVSDIKIDGILNEAAWLTADKAKDFYQFEPYNGRNPSQRSVIKVLYNDRGIYVGAMLYDTSPDSILTELGLRDSDNLNADIFTIDISPYNDGQNAYEFKVTASGVQSDTKHSTNFKDENWDAVWKSAVSITDSGWIAEFKIPYSAIRFPKEEIQTWGINFWRNIRRYREWSTWNYIDNKKDGVFLQSGQLTDLKNIKPPLRLSFVPYLAGYAERKPDTKSWSYSYNYGMDVKIGLSESFTFDATLIPDFGQVQSDDKIINLTPFETYYNEKRPFFTEGTELFDKGGIFYSRRIGGEPDGYEDIVEDYEDGNISDIIENPEEIQLINASKLSGRTKKGLGIGVFNAINSNSFAKVRDTLGNEIKIKTNPATNYNMLVFDQSLKNNSYVSLYNTNVYSGGKNYTANVSGTELRLTDNNDMYSVFTRINVSQKYYPKNKPELGHSYYIELAKISGNFRFEVYENVISDKYDINDMGFMRNNNEFSNGFNLEYNTYEPFWKLIRWENEFSLNLDYLYAPRLYSSLDFEFDTKITTKKYLTIGLNTEIQPIETHDHFESRNAGRVVILPSNYELQTFYSPDYRKKFVVDLRAGFWKSTKYDQFNYTFSIGPRFRFNDRMFVKFNINYLKQLNDIGYVTDSINNNKTVIIMGTRDIQRVTNTLDASYIFTPKASLTFRLRHYWVTVDYNQFYNLKEDGYMSPNNYDENHNFSYNAFNIDMIFTWEFAPGSEFLVIYKNNIDQQQENIPKDFFRDIEDTFSSPMTNSFSIKVLYYLDYQYLKRKNKRSD
ncbi:DUF5916 domain-containing protein [Bacteroidota bacterium]